MTSKSVVQRVADGEARFAVTPIVLSHPELEEKLEVLFMEDAMKLQFEGVWARFPVTAKQQQEIADLVGGVFHTTKTADARHLAARTIVNPVTRVNGGITAIAPFLDYNRDLDKSLEKVGGGGGGIASSVGKPWTLTNMMAVASRYGAATAWNYGWHVSSGWGSSPGGLRVIQGLCDGMSRFIHNDEHVDPSQVCEFPMDDATLIRPDGSREPVSLKDMYQSPIYHRLVSYEGSLTKVRQPRATPRQRCVYVFPEDKL